MNWSLSEEERKRLRGRIKWFLFARVLLLTFFLGIAAFLYFLRGELDNFGPFQWLLIIGYTVSLGSVLVLPRIQNLAWFSYAQINFDVLLVTGVVLITGNLNSPFAVLYNLAIVNGSILLFHRGAMTTAMVSSLCYTLLMLWGYYQSPAAGITTMQPLIMGLALNVPTFFIIALLSGFLAHRLYETEKLLKEQQRAYLDLEALKETLIQGLGSGVAITDMAGQINYFNAQAQTITSLQDTAIKGQKLADIFPGLTYSFDGRPDQKKIVVNEFPFTDPQGGSKHLRLTLASLSDPSEQPIGFVSIFEDITKRKDLEEKVRLEEEMRKVRERELLKEKVSESPRDFRFEGVVGQGGGVGKIYQLVHKVATTNTNVLIMGESGTGKELVARAIHFNGPRGESQFVAVNCGAIPENLMESELFGHVRGAFTGAVSDHDGLFKQANGGTMFLDEVGELPLHLQVKLLRVLQEKVLTPVGGTKQIKVDVRVISASNRDLRKEMEKGRFREDLFYRLNVVQMTLPPLRSRKEDVPLLTQHFIRKFAASHNKQVEEISSEALMYLMNYSFPGNIRELENIIEHAVAVTNRNILTEEDLPLHVRGVPISEEFELFEKTAPGGGDTFFNKGMSLDDELSTHEKCLLLGALKRANGVQKRAAELLGINYRSFRHRLEKYGLLSMKGHGIPEESEAG